MKRIMIMLSLLLVVFAVSVPTQTQAPTPPPEVKALEVFMGEWTYEGDVRENPIGPDGKLTGKLTNRWILNGFFIEARFQEKGPTGEVEGIEIDWYDPISNTYPGHWYMNDGNTGCGSATKKGNIWNFNGSITQKGIQYNLRVTNTFEADEKSFTHKADISTDGKTWTPWLEFKAKKVTKK